MKVYALMDCNNFYASCERAFQPQLVGKPIVVLSNNDGCVIARSNEAKALNVAMGVPFWEIKKVIKEHNIHVFSSNYPLYGDMSERIMNIAKDHCGDIEVYSIDESFLTFDTQFNTVETTCKTLRAKVLQGTGVPVSIGIAPTKTLAKIANHVAKKGVATGFLGHNMERSNIPQTCGTEGVFALIETDIINEILSNFEVNKVWGIGRAYQKTLADYGILTAFDLKNASQTWIKQKFGVVMLRTVKELNGIPCLALEPPVESRQNVMVSRSFRKDVYAISELTEALSMYATRLGEKLRQYKQTTAQLTIFLWTNPHKRLTVDAKIYFSETIKLPYATSDTAMLIHYALMVLKKIYQPKLNYKKGGILAHDLMPDNATQGNLFESMDTAARHKTLMRVMDSLNKKYGKETLQIASCGVQHTPHTWSRQAQFCSAGYTTKWGEILRVK
jgi:DNA polymerase V